MSITPRVQTFFNMMVERGLCKNMAQMTEVWQEVHKGNPCTALITTEGKRKGEQCGRPCVKGETTCMPHLSKEKKEAIKAAAAQDEEKVAKKARKSEEKKEKKEAKKAADKAQKLAEKAQKPKKVKKVKEEVAEEEFRPLRLQNGWYVQRYAPMLRVAVPYGEISSKQLSVLATIAKDYDQPEEALFAKAQAQQDLLPGKSPKLIKGYGHFTTRQNVQFNWIPLSKSADVMDLLASVDMHGIQTSGNCIRNITTDELAGVALDEVVDPRPYAEILRQWSTLHPEFAFLPRKFKIAITGASEDRAAIGWHDVGLQLVKDAKGEVGFKVWVGGGMGRTPVIGTLIREFLPWQQIMNFLEAVVRVYNRWGRRDNIYKARIKILVKAEGQRYIDEVEAEFNDIVNKDGGPHTITQAEFDRVAACFVAPQVTERVEISVNANLTDPAYQRWLKQNVVAHQNPSLRAVSLSYKRLGDRKSVV